jgi:hypothetical protein
MPSKKHEACSDFTIRSIREQFPIIWNVSRVLENAADGDVNFESQPPRRYRQGRKRRIDAHVFLAGNQHIAGETVVSNSTFIKSSCSQLSEPAQFVTRRFDHEMWW